MLNTEHDRPGLDEQYIMATNASDLTVDSNKVTAVDFLIEAGLVGNRMGAILIHLAGEWAASDKPPKLVDADIVALAELLPRLNAKGEWATSCVATFETELKKYLGFGPRSPGDGDPGDGGSQ